MKKRMVAIALAAEMVMTTFAGCGGAEETVETQKSENTEKTSEDAVKSDSFHKRNRYIKPLV